jgi:phosphatidylethanolamine-binding protein (PEBP) family uncharacterized protein
MKVFFDGREIKSGQEVPRSWTTKEPSIEWDEKKRQTDPAILALVDWDAPFPEAPTKSPLLHALHVNDDALVPYIGMNPPASSAPHRYELRAYALDGPVTRSRLQKLILDWKRTGWGSLGRENFPLSKLEAHWKLRLAHSFTWTTRA